MCKCGSRYTTDNERNRDCDSFQLCRIRFCAEEQLYPTCILICIMRQLASTTVALITQVQHADMRAYMYSRTNVYVHIYLYVYIYIYTSLMLSSLCCDLTTRNLDIGRRTPVIFFFFFLFPSLQHSGFSSDDDRRFSTPMQSQILNRNTKIFL